MPKRQMNIIKANGTVVIFETVIGSDYRISIPTVIRGNIDIKTKVRVTIEKQTVEVT